MVTRYKRSTYKLTELLRALEANQSDYKLLLRLQRELVVRITRTDRRIVDLRQRRRALNKQKRTGARSKAASQFIKRQIEAVDKAVSDAQWLLFLWRCFGDGIAFIYLDKYALKHMLYNTLDYSMKEAAGPLLRKEGHKQEWSIVRAMAKKKVPAVLCDITNTLRHGDLCALIGPDPFPIEIKSSANRNVRTARQFANLEALYAFLKTDEAENFRGIDKVHRKELPVSRTNYISAMNDCIQRSRHDGFATVSPEKGLTYMCIRSRDAVDRLRAAVPSECIVEILNEAKNQQCWPPYYPFTLSIREPQDLYDFVNGSVIAAVFVETRAVIIAFERKGLHAQFVEHHERILVVSRLGREPTETPRFAVSLPFFMRLFYEFDPIGALADMGLALIQDMEKMEGEAKDWKACGAKDTQWPEFKPKRWPTA